MYHVQLTEVTDEAKESLNIAFGEFAEAVVYESSDVPVKELQPKEYIGFSHDNDYRLLEKSGNLSKTVDRRRNLN